MSHKLTKSQLEKFNEKCTPKAECHKKCKYYKYKGLLASIEDCQKIFLIEELRAKLKTKPIKWTKKMPKKEGWYYFKSFDSDVVTIRNFHWVNFGIGKQMCFEFPELSRAEYYKLEDEFSVSSKPIKMPRRF